MFKEGESNELQKSEADPRNHEFLKPKSGAPDRVPNPISSWFRTSGCFMLLFFFFVCLQDSIRPSDSELLSYYRELDASEFQETLDDRPSGAPFKEQL